MMSSMSRTPSQEGALIPYMNRFLNRHSILVYDGKPTIYLAPVPKWMCPFLRRLKSRKYSVFSSALSLGNTLLCWFSFLYMLFRLSMTLVV